MSIREVVCIIQEARIKAEAIEASGIKSNHPRGKLLELLAEAEKQAVSWWNHAQERKDAKLSTQEELKTIIAIMEDAEKAIQQAPVEGYTQEFFQRSLVNKLIDTRKSLHGFAALIAGQK